MGRPLLAYTIETASRSKYLNDVILSTDSRDIEDIARKFGINDIVHRPDDLATDTASKWDVFVHAVETYERTHGITVDYIVDMDVTVPLKNEEDVDGAIRLAIDHQDADVIITGYEPERNPYFNMMEINDQGLARIVKEPLSPIVRRQDAPTVYSLTPAAYVIRKKALYEYPHWSQAKCRIYPIPRKRAIDIDTEIDFKLVEFLMEQP